MDTIKMLMTISFLKKKIKKLRRNYIPNQEMLDFRNRLVETIPKIKNLKQFRLRSGVCNFSLCDIADMAQLVADKGNFYVLLLGDYCNLDLGRGAMNDEIDIDIILDNCDIKRMPDTSLNKNDAYLIAVDNLKQTSFDNKNVVKFVRE
jgi:hypothetical protein